MESLGKICFAIIIIFLSSIIGGFVFMTLWKWFVVSTFNLPVISLAKAIGLMLFINYLKPKLEDKDEDISTVDKLGKSFIKIITFALFILGLGWTIFQFI